MAVIPPLTNYTRADMYSDFRKVFGTGEGRRVMGHIMAWCDFYAPTVIPKDMTATEAALVHEGKRIVGILLAKALRPVDSSRAEEKVGYGGRS